MTTLNTFTDPAYPVLIRTTYVWNAETRRHDPHLEFAFVAATVRTIRTVGAWAARRDRDAHLMTLTYARFTHPESGKEITEHYQGNEQTPGDTSDCRHHAVSWVLFKETLDETDPAVLDRYVSCEDCRAMHGLAQIKDPRHYIPLAERPPREPTQKEIKLAKFGERFEAKYGHAPLHFETFQNANSNARLWKLKNLIEYPFGYNHARSGTPARAKRVTAIMQAAGRVADLEGNAALERHVAALLGRDVRWGEEGKNPRHASDWFLDGKTELFNLSQLMTDAEIDALLLA